MGRLIAILLMGILGACSAAPSAPDWPGNAAAGAFADAGPYEVRPGDRVGIRFPAYPHWNASLLVRPDGGASVPLLGDVDFAGHTLPELETSLYEGLVERVRSPRVELVLEELHRRAVYVGGEVANPGAFELSGPRASLLEALFDRGGPLEATAALDTVVISRVLDGRRRSWLVDVSMSLEGDGEPVLLIPGDVLLVPGTRIVQADRFVEQYITRMIPGSNLLAGLILAGN